VAASQSLRRNSLTPGKRRRSRLLLGVGIGVLLGLGPAYHVIVSFTPRSLPPKESSGGLNKPRAPESVGSLRAACMTLAEDAGQMRRLLARRARARASLGAHLGAVTVGLDATRADRSPSRKYIAGREYALDAYTRVVVRLAAIWQEAGIRQAELWQLLAAADQLLPQCKQTAADNESAPEVQVIGRRVAPWDPVELRNSVETAATSLRKALSEVGEPPNLVDTISMAVTQAEQPNGAGSGLLAGAPSRAIYVDWSANRIYAVGGLGAAPGSDDYAGLQSYQRSIREARASLLNGLMDFPIHSDRVLRDLVVTNPGLRGKLVQLINANDVVSHRDPKTRAAWVEIRLPLAGNGGLIPLLLPFTVAPGSALITDRSLETGEAPRPSSQSEGFQEPARNVVIDARGIGVRPLLFPRVLAQSGTVVVDGARGEPNRVAQHGFCTYTTYEGEARVKAGLGALWIEVVGSERAGELIVDDRDADRLRATRLGTFAGDSALIILTDGLPRPGVPAADPIPASFHSRKDRYLSLSVPRLWMR